MTAYTETCASVANVFWNHRLYRATGEAKYLDVLERTLYNGLISGIGSDGCHFFYPNPLESDGSFERAGWFDCSCCPVNVARFMPSMKQYIWSESGDGVNVNLFIGSEARLKTSTGEVFVRQTTDFPWRGDVKINVDPDNEGSSFKLRIRVPGWTGAEPFEGGLYRYVTAAKENMGINVNGKKITPEVINGFAVIERKWNHGDEVDITLPMEPRFIAARQEVKADSGRIALGIGPLVYCLEEADNGKVRDIKIDPETKVDLVYDGQNPAAALTLVFDAMTADGQGKKVRSVPYYSWANRGKGEMIVWMKNK
jgi:hypothetical protein